MSKYDEQPVERDDSVATTDENIKDIVADSSAGTGSGSELGRIADDAGDDHAETGGVPVIDATHLSDQPASDRPVSDRPVSDAPREHSDHYLAQGHPGYIEDEHVHDRDRNLEQGHPGYVHDDESDDRPRLAQGHPGYMDDEGRQVRSDWDSEGGHPEEDEPRAARKDRPSDSAG